MKAFYPTFKGVLCTLVITLLCLATASAQRISGTVVDAETKESLAGATVAVQGATRGTATDATGAFSVEARAGDVLLVSYIGYAAQTVTVGNTANITIELKQDFVLQEVTIGGLGLNKEKAKVGYAVQDIKGDDLLKAREPNAINALVGKVSGLTIGASPELLGGPTISLRGGRPIFVVDGIPINSDTWNISADDVETYTVLKGPTAAALYGFRSVNGVILITTKKGTKDKRGVSVEFNTSQMIESGFNAIPKVQDLYGPGDHGRYSFTDGRGGGTNDGDYDIWGPKFEGQNIKQYDSPVDASGARSATPWTARGTDNLQRFLRPGFQSNNNIAVSTSTDKLDMRYSTSYNYTQGMVPNTQLHVANFNVYSGLKFNDRLKWETNLNYNRQFTDNIPDVQYGPNSMIYNITIWGGADWDIDQLRDYWQPGKEGTQQIYAEYQRYNNPWFLANEWLRGHQKTDIYGQTGLTYQLAPGLELKGRTAITSYDLIRSEKFPYSATVYNREEARGDYREDKRTLFDNNTDLFLSLNRKVSDAISLQAVAGGNLRNFEFGSNYTTTNYLNVPGLYAFTNTANPLIASNFKSKMRVQSAYYSVDLGLKTWLFLSHTGRVDHLSTLPKDQNTFFYPSVGASVVVSELAPKLFNDNAFSFLKLRGSFASVKAGLTSSTIGATPGQSYPLGYGAQYNSSYDGPTYENASVYSSPLVYNSQAGSYFTNALVNSDLQPSTRFSYEGGLEARFIRNRIGFDLTYYQNIDGPQIFSKPISQASGYSSQLLNAVKIKTAGLELSITGTPFKNANGFSWDVLANWSTYRRTYLELPDGVERLYSFYKKGDRVDGYYDSAPLKTKDGQLIHDKTNGTVLANPVAQKLGHSDPDWVWSLYNRVSWKNLSLGIQFDGRVGGEITNYIRRQTFRGGRHIETTEGEMGIARNLDFQTQKINEDKNPQEDGNYLGAGVKLVGSVTPTFDQFGNITNYDQLQFATNDNKTYLQDYISRYYRLSEASLMSKTFAKLREVTVTCELPKKWFEGGRLIQRASVSLVGRNLLYFAEQKDIDLDNYIDSNYSGLQSPTAKRYGVNINITF